jgi:hypothetical protein
MTGRVNISGSVILRGAGQDKTTLFFRKPVGQKGGRGYSFGPGSISFQGEDPVDNTTFLAKVAKNAERGDRIIFVSSTKGFFVGQWVRITASDPGKPGECTWKEH